MAMDDWDTTNFVDNSLGGTWVYKENSNFAGIHFSFCVDDSARHHAAYNDKSNYYYGVTNSFSAGYDATLENAWKDYYTV